MKSIQFSVHTLTLLALVCLTGALRVLINTDPHLYFFINFTPVGAMALFGGACFQSKKKAFGFPLLTLLISDIVLYLLVYRHTRHELLYEGWYWTYVAFAFMTLVGRILLQKTSTTRLLLAVMVCTLIHWIITDLGVWLNGTLYTKTISGWVACLTAALPFEGSFMAGMLLYSAVLFGLAYWLNKKYPVLKVKNVTIQATSLYIKRS
jgi:hypothetical protein